MKQQVSPTVVIVAIVLLIGIIGFFAYRTVLAPKGPEGSETLTMKGDLSKLKPGDFDQVKKDLEAAKATRDATATGK